MENWIDLNNLPRDKGGRIWWRKIVHGTKLNFIYNNIEGFVELGKLLDDSYIEVIFKDKIYKFLTYELSKCKLNKLFNKKVDSFLLNIGDKTKNKYGEYKILDRFIKNKSRKYLVKCSVCGNESVISQTRLLDKNSTIGCVGCSSYKTIVGFNSMYDTDRWVLKYISEDDAKKYTRGNGNVIEITCPDCGFKKNMKISNFTRYGMVCNVCSDGVSFPEKLVSNLLNELKIKFKREVNGTEFSWIKNYRYDFYLEDYNLFIEVDGEDHVSSNRKPLSETLRRDREKDELCKNNGFNLIRVDCRDSRDIELLNKNIKCSFSKFLNYELTDDVFNKCLNNAKLTNILKEVCLYWKDNDTLTTQDIGNVFGFSRTTIREYLKRGSEIWEWCNYNPTIGKLNSLKKGVVKQYKPIDVFKDGVYLTTYKSVSYLVSISEKEFGKKMFQGNISSVARGDMKSYHGYTFKYSDKPIEYFLENKEECDSHES